MGEVGARQFGFQLDHAVQNLLCFGQLAHLYVELAEVAQCFKIFFDGQGFGKAFHGIVGTVPCVARAGRRI